MALLRVAELKATGAKLRIDGAYGVTTPAEHMNWLKDRDAWHGDVAEQMTIVSPVAARSFATIGRVQQTDYVADGHYISQQHADDVAHASAWLRMLTKFLDERVG